MSYSIEKLSGQHERSQFSCGEGALDQYIKTQAGQDLRRHMAVPYVLVRLGQMDVIGYYTLSSFAIAFEELPVSTSKKLPRYSLIPATLLGRLAVDVKFQGQNLGELILFDALRRCVEQSKSVASYVIVVDALNERAHSFYKKFGFIELQIRADRLFLPIRSVESLV